MKLRNKNNLIPKTTHNVTKPFSLPITQFLPITELVMTVPAPTEVPLLIKRFSSNLQSLQKGKN